MAWSTIEKDLEKLKPTVRQVGPLNIPVILPQGHSSDHSRKSGSKQDIGGSSRREKYGITEPYWKTPRPYGLFGATDKERLFIETALKPIDNEFRDYSIFVVEPNEVRNMSTEAFAYTYLGCALNDNIANNIYLNRRYFTRLAEKFYQGESREKNNQCYLLVDVMLHEKAHSLGHKYEADADNYTRKIKEQHNLYTYEWF